MSHDVESEQRVFVFCEIRYDGDVVCLEAASVLFGLFWN